MTNFRMCLLLLAFIAFSCTDETSIAPQQEQIEVLSRAAIDEIIINSLKQNDEFNWSDASDQVIWSALIHSDSIITIGYKPDGAGDINSRISEIDIKSSD